MEWSFRNLSHRQGSTDRQYELFGPWIPSHHHQEGFFSYSSVLVKSWLGRFVRVAGIFQV